MIADGSVTAMGEDVRGTLPIAVTIGGVALLCCPAFLHYTAPPEEQNRKHLTVRITLAVGDVGLVLLVSRLPG